MKTIVAMLVLLMTTPIAAQNLYQIDEIRTEGSRIPLNIVRAELMIDPGESYTEDQIRLAVYRIRRLPFVFSANWRVEPSADTGRQTLVITIQDENRFFYSVDLEGGADDNDESGRAAGGFGGRLFTRNGVAELSLGNFESTGGSSVQSITGSYRAFGLFGTAASASLGLSREFDGDVDPQPIVQLHIPLGLRHGLRARATQLGSESDTLFGSNVPFTQKMKITMAELDWVFDTTEDPHFARRGLVVSAGPRWFRSERTSASITSFDPPVVIPVESESDQYGIVSAGTSYRPLGDRSALFSRFQASATRFTGERNGVPNLDLETAAAGISGGIARNFGTPLDTIGPWRSRLEGEAGYARTWRDSSLGSSSDDTFNVTGAWALRHSWGTVRLAATYVWD